MKEFNATQKGVVFKIHAHTGKPEFKMKAFSEWRQAFEIETKAMPVKGKANEKIEKKLSEFFQAECRIQSGFESKNKTVIAKTTPEKFMQCLKTLVL